MSNRQSRLSGQRKKSVSPESQQNISTRNKVKKPQLSNRRVSKTQSAQDFCKNVQEIVQKKPWNKSLAEKFVRIVVDPNKQFELIPEQRQILQESILTCPLQYRAWVHLNILFEVFIRGDSLHTMNGITRAIVSAIGDELTLESGIEESLIKAQEDNRLIDWLLRKSKEKGTETLDLDFARKLISYLIHRGDKNAIPSRLDIIIGTFAGSSNLKLNKCTPETIIKNKVEAVTRLFSLERVTSVESQRIFLYGNSEYSLILKQAETISRLQNERNKNDMVISGLQNQCEELQAQLVEIKEKFKDEKNKLEKERRLYSQLKQDSTVKVDQQRNSTLNQVRSRIENSLDKLERCFSGNPNSFAANSQMGLDIIKDIRRRLSN